MNKQRIRAIGVFALGLLLLALGAMPARATTHTVNIAPGGQLIFQDQTNLSPTTTINVGDTVTWVWQADHHSTTSGACPPSCGSGGSMWDSGVFDHGHTFSF